MNPSTRTGLFGTMIAVVLLWATAADATTIRVHYDTGFGNRITIRGSVAPLSWTTGKDATWTTGNVWGYSWPDSAGDRDLKPLVNDTKWSIGAIYHVRAATTTDVYPFFNSSSGSLF